MSDYQASGGTSRIHELGSDEHLQIEVHQESYSVLWATELWNAGASESLVRLLPSTVRSVTIHQRRQDELETRDSPESNVEDLLRWVRDRAENADFVRLDFEDRVLTWESRDDPEERFNEIGFLAHQFDPSYLVAMILATATPSVVALAEEAIYGSSDIVDRFPRADLYPGELLP